MYSPGVHAAVIDTNLWASGRLDVARLGNLAARLGRHDVEVWVPHQVVLEWARHAYDDVVVCAPLWKRFARSGLVQGALSVSSDLDELVTCFHRIVSGLDNVHILPMLGTSALAAITDQILGTGPGSVRNGVRTGAADSAWIRDALARADQDPGKIVFVTANVKDVHTTLAHHGADPARVRVSKVENILDMVAHATDASQQMTTLLAGHLLGVQAAAIALDAGTPWLVIEDCQPNEDILHSDVFDVQSSLLQLTVGPELVALREVRLFTTPGADPDTHSIVECTAVLTAPMTVTTPYPVGADAEISTLTHTLAACLLSVRLVADVDHGRIGPVTTGGAAYVEPCPEVFWSPRAAQAMVSAMFAVAGITLHMLDTVGENTGTLTGFGTRTLDYIARRHPHELWELEFRVGEDRLGIRCENDTSGEHDIDPDHHDGRYVVRCYDSRTDGTPTYSRVISAIWRDLIGYSAP